MYFLKEPVLNGKEILLRVFRGRGTPTMAPFALTETYEVFEFEFEFGLLERDGTINEGSMVQLGALHSRCNGLRFKVDVHRCPLSRSTLSV